MRQDALRKGTSRRAGAEPDAVDVIIEEWRRERPDLDPSAKHVTGRIVRLAARFQEAFDEAFRDLGITDRDYGVLAPLRRAGSPFTLTPTELARHKMITSGGMTAALDRLERQGLLERLPNPADRRGSLVRLTERGREVIDVAMERHAAAEQSLVGALEPAQRAALADLLRTLVRGVEAG